jgi:hypothetical protein
MIMISDWVKQKERRNMEREKHQETKEKKRKEEIRGKGDLLSKSAQRFVSELLSSPFLVNLSETIKVALFDGILQLGEFVHILLVHVHDGQTSRSLLVNNLSEARLTLDNSIGDTHALAQSREPHNKLDGLNIMGNDHKASFLLLDQSSDVVETELDHIGASLSSSGLVALDLLSSKSLQSQLLGLGVLRAVLVEESESATS